MDQLPPEVLLEHLARSLIDYPEDLKVTAFIGEQTAVFEIHVPSDDFGKLVGKRYCNIIALRQIFGAVYGKLRKRVQIEVIEP
jgi:predicted RNA-binding protein YlqC (UPF0109 family)